MKTELFLLCLVVCPCAAYKFFQDELPNGRIVPNPCKANTLWKGVGHLALGGGGARNAFGLDFYKNGKKWDKCLCETDSDGDGKTNGEELGDPRCVWFKDGPAPERNFGLSHPGICEPLDDPMCRIHNTKFGDICEGAESEHPCLGELRNEAGVQTWDVRHPSTKVPPKETTYMCQTFSVPDVSKDYHLIGNQPIIDNDHVLHHILIYGCTDSAEEITEPRECGMGVEGCSALISTWAVGLNGDCFMEEFGMLVGKSGFKTVLMQTHWNNPNERTDYMDGSGLRLYITPNLRPNSGSILMVGQTYLRIPGNRKDVMEEGMCASECTRDYPHSLNLVNSAIHMHYLGNKGYIEHIRDGKVINQLVDQDEYSYDTPVDFPHNPPIEFRPGDEIRTVCHFQSTSRSEMTYFGDATSQEMCFGFITYYPPLLEGACNQFKDTQTCHTMRQLKEDGRYTFAQCAYDTFFNRSDAIFKNISAVCDPTGQTCSSGCRSRLDYYKSRDVCFSGDAYYYTQMIIPAILEKEMGQPEVGRAVFNMMESCEAKDNMTPVEQTPEPEEDGNAGEDGGLCANKPTPKYPGISASDKLLPVTITLILSAITAMVI